MKKHKNRGKTAHFKPETAFTDKVVVKVDAKTHLLLRRFSRLNPAEDTESRKTAIRGYLLKAVMDAYNKYDPSRGCAYETYVELFLSSAAKHYIRDYSLVLAKERMTESLDALIDADNERSHDFLSSLAEPRDVLQEHLDRWDMDEVEERLRRKNPLLARVFALRRDDYSLSEIAETLNVPSWEMYEVVWPAVKKAARQIYGEC